MVMICAILQLARPPTQNFANLLAPAFAAPKSRNTTTKRPHLPLLQLPVLHNRTTFTDHRPESCQVAETNRRAGSDSSLYPRVSCKLRTTCTCTVLDLSHYCFFQHLAHRSSSHEHRTNRTDTEITVTTLLTHETASNSIRITCTHTILPAMLSATSALR